MVAPSGASSRSEVRALAARLEEGLARGGSAGALEELWQGVELELVRQACVHCAERGELMEAVRRRREAQAGVMRRQVAAQRLEPILSITVTTPGVSSTHQVPLTTYHSLTTA